MFGAFWGVTGANGLNKKKNKKDISANLGLLHYFRAISHDFQEN